ncbi:MAG: uncharacterized protein JWO63_139 [Frankiales bacterium]|nr:uncharacterized protein [Frankiales bacterium]
MISALVLLVPLALPLLWFVFHLQRQRLGLGVLSLRGSLVLAFIVFEVCVDLISETTSLGHHFTRHGAGLAWGVLDLVLLAIALRIGLAARLATVPARVWRASRSMSRWEALVAVLGAAELIVFIVMAAAYVPTNGDSLVYHLARVANWVQNGSVQHYATQYPAEIELSPLHEYTMAQLHVLGGTDRLDSFVQLFAVVICVVGASEITRLLGGSRNAQVLAAGLTATVPSLILEATSTQNNDFAAAIAIGLLVLTLAWRPAGRFLPSSVLIGGALGLSALTKGTLLIFAATTGVVLVGAQILRHVKEVGVARMAGRIAVAGVAAGVVCLVVAGPFFHRNIEVYGGLTGPTTRTTLSYDLTPQAATANVIRSTASNFAIGDGSGPESWVSRAALGTLKQLYEPTHVDPSDWHYMIGNYSDAFGSADYSSRQLTEEFGANPWDVIGIGIALAAMLVLVVRGDRRLRLPLLLGLGISAAFVIFSATARWSPYGVRYQVPLFVAWCPLMALVLARAWRWVGRVVLIGLFVLAQPMLLYNVSRPIAHPTWSRGTGIVRYYHPWAGAASAGLASVAEGQTDIATLLAQTDCHTLGEANWIEFEYPLWVALDEKHWTGHISDVDVTNASKKLENPSFKPCALIRQVTAGYVNQDPKMVTLPFAGGFALSLNATMAAKAAAAFKSDMPTGFSSSVEGVQLMHVSGWVTAATTPTFKASAALYLSSQSARTVSLTLAGLSATTTAVVNGGRPVAVGASRSLTITLGSGLNSVVLTGKSTKPITASSVSVVG